MRKTQNNTLHERMRTQMQEQNHHNGSYSSIADLVDWIATIAL